MTTLKPYEPIRVKLTSHETDQRDDDIRRDIGRVVDTVRLTKVVGRSQQRDHQQCTTAKRLLMRTPVTEHTPGVTMAATWSNQIRTDAFKSPTKIPSLRKSPALIRWPARGPPIKTKPKPKVVSLPDLAKNSAREQALRSAEGGQRPRKPKLPKFDDMDGEEEDEEEEEDNYVPLPPWKPVPYANFWDTAYGNIRIDRHFIGSPMVDPHHSTWTPDARRCYFMHRPQPLHYQSQALRKMPSDFRASLSKDDS